MNLKRWTGILLICAAAFMALALFVMWGLPVLFPPEDPEDSLPHLWEKFYKVDKARTREYGGSGIGLSIVKAIMESMNQKYGVINYENGVRFWFELELAGEESEITPAISEKNS